MLANQTMVANDGYEVALFPFEYLYITQGENGTTSHQGTYNVDFAGYGPNGVVYRCPFYAPCTLECVNISFSPSNNSRTYQSVNKVHLADGTLNYLTINFLHDNNPLYNVGDIIPQGQLLGHTGTYGNVTGDHIHSCCGAGVYSGYTQRSTGRWDLSNRIHYYDALYVNDTVIVQGYGYNWKTYQGGVTPVLAKRGKFPWVLFARKLRNKSHI